MKIFLIGIKGSGMCALASILKDSQHDVLGSDVEKVFFTDNILLKKNIKIVSFDESFITEDIDLVILGNAFADNHPQVISAEKKNIKTIRYYNFLNDFSYNKTSIAISGTNGKTTTTSLLCSMFEEKKPNYLIGDGHGYGNINSDLFIFEACEYKRTFLNYNPQIAIINNIEMDHPDYFKDLNDVINAFKEFAQKSNTLILNFDDENIKSMHTELSNDTILTFSLHDTSANLSIQDLSESSSGYTLTLNYNGKLYHNINIPFYGTHMLQNSLACILCGLHLNMNMNDIIAHLSNFKGAKRRFEKYILNEEKQITLIDDYAHHPTSIQLVIEAIRQNYPNHVLNILFQPHTFSRTIEFLDEFTTVLSQADNLYLEPIFGSIREQNNEYSEYLLNDNFKKKYPHTLKEDISDIIDVNSNNQIYLLLGAGDLDKKYIPFFIETFKKENQK